MPGFFEKNRQFGTVDAIFAIALMAIVVLISSSVLSEVFADHRRVQARMKAEAIAFRLASRPDAITERSESGRAPASVEELNQGQIGEDPWGRPYQYQIRRTDMGTVEEVSVWSQGPTKETPDKDAPRRIGYIYTPHAEH